MCTFPPGNRRVPVQPGGEQDGAGQDRPAWGCGELQPEEGPQRGAEPVVDARGRPDAPGAQGQPPHQQGADGAPAGPRRQGLTWLTPPPPDIFILVILIIKFHESSVWCESCVIDLVLDVCINQDRFLLTNVCYYEKKPKKHKQ